MYALPDLEKATGYTTDQLRDRLRLLQPILGESFHKGSRGKVLVSDGVLTALRRMVELERDGLSAKVAAGEVVKKLGNGDGNGSGTVAYGQGTSVEAVLRERIADLQDQLIELRKDRDQWRELAMSVRPALTSGEPRRSWLYRLVFGGP